MECFYILQRVSGWLQCQSIWIWNGLIVWRYSIWSFNLFDVLSCVIDLPFRSCISACFWVLHRKNTSVTFCFWRKGNFTCMELQIFRCLLNCSYGDFFIFLAVFFYYWSCDLYQMLSLENFKQGTCCSISGQVQFLMHQLKLFKGADPLRCELLVLQRWPLVSNNWPLSYIFTWKFFIHI